MTFLNDIFCAQWTDHLICISRTKVRKYKEVNWLPAPKGPFTLIMRLYGAKIGSAHGQMEPTAGHARAVTAGFGCSVEEGEYEHERRGV
jgi:hypothetical protein